MNVIIVLIVMILKDCVCFKITIIFMSMACLMILMVCIYSFLILFSMPSALSTLWPDTA